MPKFSEKSKEKLTTCVPELQRLFNEVIKEKDCSIICGHRTKEEQEAAFKENKSKLQFPKSKHNFFPSKAVDVMPFPINWNDLKGIAEFAKFVLDKAKELNISIRWGGDWDRDGDWKGERFLDMPHYEIIE